MRLAALVAANAACLAVLWRIHGAEEPAPSAAAASAVATDPALLVPAPPPREPDRWLTARVRKRITDALRLAQKETDGKLDGSAVRIAVHAREAGVPGDLVAIDSDNPMRPASNMKLATSAAALVLLGRDGRFVTRFGAAEPPAGGRLAGDLVVRAGADPIYDP